MQISDIRRQLIDRRRQILEQRQKNSDSWQTLQEPEVELEETAAKDKMARLFEQLDDREKTEIEQIDKALAKLNASAFGRCESCGRRISEGRLNAVPWTPWCIRCAENREGGPSRTAPGPGQSAGTAWSPESQGFSDTQIQEMIEDRLSRDGRIETDELDIYSQEGWVHLEGSLPSSRQHELLTAILQDTLGFKDIVDHIKVDRQLWEQEKPDSPRGTENRQTWKEKQMEGKTGETDVWTSREFGTPLDPPDSLNPERK